MKKFFKQIIMVEIVSDECPAEYDTLSELDDAITIGDSVGQFTEMERKEITREEMEKFCEENGSDPSFFED